MLSVLAWDRWEAENNGRLPAYSRVKHSIIADSRNALARQFLNHRAKAEWLWVLDPDIEFMPDACHRLLEVADPKHAPIVAGAYWNEYADPDEGVQHALTWHAQTEKGLQLFRRLPKIDQAIELGSCGMGCTLIHRSVFTKLARLHRDDPWPWFGHDIIPGLEDRAGEDVTFCLRARKAGFRVVGHCGVTVEHYKPTYMRHGED